MIVAKRIACVVLGGIVLAAAGCTRSQETPAAEKKSAPAAQAPASAPQAASFVEVSGTVLETMNAAGYTYLRLKTPSGETWAAVNEAKVEKGAAVTVTQGMLMEDFESKTLKRRFDKIIFGTLAGGPEVALATGHGPSSGPSAASPMTAPHGVVPPAAAMGEVRVPKAEGGDGKTVAAVYSAKAALKDKTIAVRGKVVKFLPGIMGRNWLHLQDGSGSAEKRDHDLTVTTQDTAAVGDVILVRGIVRLDKDFGAGYAYPVILEEAKLSK